MKNREEVRQNWRRRGKKKHVTREGKIFIFGGRVGINAVFRSKYGPLQVTPHSRPHPPIGPSNLCGAGFMLKLHCKFLLQ